MNRSPLKQIPNRFNSTCFACSPKNPSGLQMHFMAGEDFVQSELQIPQHLCGWNNLAHGGILTTILDEIMSWTAMHFLKQLVMTKTLNISFLKSINVGETIKAVGRVKQKSGRHEVIMEGVLCDQKGRECVKAEAVFATLSPKIANRFGINREEYPDWFEASS